MNQKRQTDAQDIKKSYDTNKECTDHCFPEDEWVAPFSQPSRTCN